MSDAPARGLNSARLAMWLAVGMLVAAAVLGGFFIIVGDQSNVAGRAWMTLFLVAGFAGAVLLDTAVTRGRNPLYVGASTIVNVVLVAIGLLKIWNGWGQPADTADGFVWAAQVLRFFAVIVLLRAAVGLTQLYVPFALRKARSSATRVASFAAVVCGWLTALVLAIPAAFPAPEWPDWWWRASGATALVSVVLLVIPPIVRAFEGRDDSPLPAASAGGSPGYPQAGYAQAAYPPPGYPQPGYAQPGAAPQGYAQVGVPPQGFGNQPGVSPQTHGHQPGLPSQGLSPQGYGQQPQPPQSFPQPGVVPQAYGQPQQVYGQPPQGFGQPQQAYGQPQQSYGQPPQGFGHPQAPQVAPAPQAPHIPQTPQNQRPPQPNPAAQVPQTAQAPFGYGQRQTPAGFPVPPQQPRNAGPGHPQHEPVPPQVPQTAPPVPDPAPAPDSGIVPPTPPQ